MLISPLLAYCVTTTGVHSTEGTPRQIEADLSCEWTGAINNPPISPDITPVMRYRNATNRPVSRVGLPVDGTSEPSHGWRYVRACDLKAPCE